MPGDRSPTEQEKSEYHGFLACIEKLPCPGIVAEQGGGKILFVNEAARLLYATTRKNLLGKSYTSLLVDSPDENTQNLETGVQCHLKADGTRIIVEVATSSLRLKRKRINLHLLREITHQRKAEEHLQEQLSHFQHLAYHDVLTGLPNRLLFQDRLKHALARARRLESRFALLFIDVDDFKAINDSFGHGVGDQVLCEVARRLKEGLREADTLARMGGDEFLVIMEQVQDRDQIAIAIRRIQALFRKNVDLDGQSISVSVSVGSSLFPVHADEPEGLIRSADSALLLAKEEGKDGFLILD